MSYALIKRKFHDIKPATLYTNIIFSFQFFVLVLHSEY